MKLIKLAVISLIVFALLLTAMASLLPSHVRVSRAIDVPALATDLAPCLADIRAWSSWNKYIDSLPNKQFLSAEAVTSPDLSVTITQKSDTLVLATWKDKTGSTFQSGYRMIAHESSTTVQWYFDFKVKWYPWEKFASIIYDRQMGPVMEESLKRLTDCQNLLE